MLGQRRSVVAGSCSHFRGSVSDRRYFRGFVRWILGRRLRLHRRRRTEHQDNKTAQNPCKGGTDSVSLGQTRHVRLPVRKPQSVKRYIDGSRKTGERLQKPFRPG